ncbi:hypothetical protein C2845_PM12G12400 [Panicum miliaceum]|uniref:Protein kish n=1 Tax=Panicum miliaceum TaxID=4540 RepID=A0A3L6QHR5_PANMI|nr:hypothetical protein C2845_PM12G12400 [Panicum miliaceum]
MQSALFNFHSFVTVVLLLICTCTYLKMHFPSLLIRRTGFRGFFWKAVRIGTAPALVRVGSDSVCGGSPAARRSSALPLLCFTPATVLPHSAQIPLSSPSLSPTSACTRAGGRAPGLRLPRPADLSARADRPLQLMREVPAALHPLGAAVKL